MALPCFTTYSKKCITKLFLSLWKNILYRNRLPWLCLVLPHIQRNVSQNFSSVYEKIFCTEIDCHGFALFYHIFKKCITKPFLCLWKNILYRNRLPWLCLVLPHIQRNVSQNFSSVYEKIFCTEIDCHGFALFYHIFKEMYHKTFPLFMKKYFVQK